MSGSLCLGGFFAVVEESPRSGPFPGVEGVVASGIDLADFCAFFALFAGFFFGASPCSSVWWTGESVSALSLVLLPVELGVSARDSGWLTTGLSCVVGSAPLVSLPNCPWARASNITQARCMGILRCGGWPPWDEPATVRIARQPAGARLAAASATLLRDFRRWRRNVPLRPGTRDRLARGSGRCPGVGLRSGNLHHPPIRRPRRARLRERLRYLTGIGSEEQTASGRLLLLQQLAGALVRRHAGGKLQGGGADPRLREPAQRLDHAGGQPGRVARGSSSEEEELLEGKPRPGRGEQRLAGCAREEPAADHTREPSREPPIDESGEAGERPLFLADEQADRFRLRFVERLEGERTERQLHGATPSSGPGRGGRSRARRDPGCR